MSTAGVGALKQHSQHSSTYAENIIDALAMNKKMETESAMIRSMIVTYFPYSTNILAERGKMSI